MRSHSLAWLACLVAAAACGDSSSTSSDGAVAMPDLAPASPLVAARPYEFDVPAGYDGTKAMPLVILLHGYSATGFIQRAYFGLGPVVDERGFFLAYPDGLKDSHGNRYWNATDACCNFDHTNVDDVAYIDAIIDDMSAHYRIDPKRVFITGHSNGAFMAHRYACDRAGRVAAIVALAGDDWLDTAKCKPSQPVAVLQVHGDADPTIPYAGTPAMPSARASVAGWAAKDGCTASPTDTSQPPVDLEATLPGADTSKERWTGCKPGGAAELWTIHGGTHIPNFTQPAWPEAIWAWFAAHPRM